MVQDQVVFLPLHQVPRGLLPLLFLPELQGPLVSHHHLHLSRTG